MENMQLIDYVRSQDRTFKEKPLTEADSVVLSALSNIDLTWFYRQCGGVPVPLSEIAAAFCGSCCEEPSKECDFLDAVGKSPRYGGVLIENPVYILEPEHDKQFGAALYRTGPDTAYLGYAGTGTSITGFKEDFLLCAFDLMPSHEEAVRYINNADLPENVVVGGFSKGGNLAVFAAAFAKDEARARVRAVYSHDGPGFPRLIRNEPKYRSLLPLVRSCVPEASLVGLCLGGIEGYEVVKSLNPPVAQHEPYSWVFEGDALKRAPGLSLLSRQFLKAQEKLLESTPKEERAEMVEALFYLFGSVGSDDFRDFLVKGTKVLPDIKDAWKGADEGTRESVRKLALRLVGAVLS